MAGCGGGQLASGGHAAAPGGTASLAVRIGGGQAPARAARRRAPIPSATVQFRIRMTPTGGDGDLVTPVFITRPATPGLVTATVDGVPLGAVRIIVDGLNLGGTILAQAVTTVVVREGQNDPVTLDPVPVAPVTPRHFVVVTNENDDTVGLYGVSPGQPPVGIAGQTAVPVGSAPHHAAVSPSRDSVYVMNSGSGDVSAFAFDAGSARLTPILNGTLSTFSLGGVPDRGLVDLNGGFLLVGANGSDVFSVPIVSGGALGSPTLFSTTPQTNSQGLILFPSSSPGFPLLYVAGNSSGDIARFFEDDSNGRLGPVKAFSLGGPGNPQKFARFASVGGTFLYAVAPDAGAVYGFAVNLGSGALTPLSGSPFTFTSNTSSLDGIAVAGNFLYVTSENDGSITIFKIDPTNGTLALAPLAVNPVPLAASAATTPLPVDLAVSANGQVLFVASKSDSARGLQQYAIQSDGSLKLEGTAPTGAHPYSVITF